MKLNQVEKAFRLCFASNVTPALVSTSGVGKTSICKQIGKSMGFENTIILRPSMVADVGDLVGLPDFTVVVSKEGQEDKRTTFNSPDWLPQEGDKSLIVIDELNRTQKDIIMAIFGLIEADDPKIGNYKLPTGCKVVATLNPPTDNYSVLDIKDSAFASRLAFIKITPNQKVFTDWGRKSGKVCDEMLDFLAKNDKFFGLGEDFEVEMFFDGDGAGNHFKNNNRSKEKVSALYTNAKELGTPRGILHECMRGIAGQEASVAFLNFADSYKNIVTLDDLMNTKDAFEKFDYSAISNVSKVLDDLKLAISKGKVTKKQATSLVPFLAEIPLDTFKGFMNYIGTVSNKGETEGKRIIKFEGVIADTDLMDRLDYSIEAQEVKTEEVKETKTE